MAAAHASVPRPATQLPSTGRPHVLSVNVGRGHVTEHTSAPGGVTGIDKRPAAGPVSVTAPDRDGSSALAGDVIGDAGHHGGPHQAVYVFAREDLDRWEPELGRELPAGVFGENLTTLGVDVTDVRIGERWRVGGEVVIEATSPRIPCRTFAGWLDERGWVRRFTADAAPGAYFRVVRPGQVRAGDPVEVVHRPDHEVSVGFWFRAVSGEPELRSRLLAAGAALPPQHLARARTWAAASDARHE